jgi:hypothetical protein
VGSMGIHPSIRPSVRPSKIIHHHLRGGLPFQQKKTLYAHGTTTLSGPFLTCWINVNGPSIYSKPTYFTHAPPSLAGTMTTMTPSDLIIPSQTPIPHRGYHVTGKTRQQQQKKEGGSKNNNGPGPCKPGQRWLPKRKILGGVVCAPWPPSFPCLAVLRSPLRSLQLG